MRPALRRSLAAAAAALALAASLLGFLWWGAPTGAPRHVKIPRGASLAEIADTLARAEAIRWARGFEWYARIRGAAARLQAGTYAVREDEGWHRTLDRLVRGDMVHVAVTIPEGAAARVVAARLAPVVERDAAEVAAAVLDTARAARLGVPGPTLEGYLYPDTYVFALGLPLDDALAAMVRRYREVWTPERRARADSLGWTERDVVTLASIVEAEAMLEEEMPLIAAVYHNRLRRGMPLQADPTVQYALPERKTRLLYADIRAVRDHPYDTYHRRGLPPGPIGSPGAAAIDAALAPANVPYLYFVARGDGTHVFSRTHREHVNAKNRIARERREATRQAAARGTGSGPDSR
jgi:UPF0755 protein